MGSVYGRMKYQWWWNAGKTVGREKDARDAMRWIKSITANRNNNLQQKNVTMEENLKKI